MFDMHDLIQEMAYYIVRGEAETPDKYSRVWKKKDVGAIFSMDTTTNLDMIEAIDIGNYFWSGKQLHILQVVARMKNLRWIFLTDNFDTGYRKDPDLVMPETFPPQKLYCLRFWFLAVTQLWGGKKRLPYLRMIDLNGLDKLIETPDFEGLPNLEIFILRNCQPLKEIDPSFGDLEKLVSVVIRDCKNLEMLPSITRSKKLETLRLTRCEKVFNSSRIQQRMENFVPHNINHIGQWFYSECLRKLELSSCDLVDEHVIRSAGVWKLTNLEEFDLSGNNKLVRLNFSLMRLPRLKYLNVSKCDNLVELSELPSSISVVVADHCDSLESFGDISNCKWLWKVSLGDSCKLDPLCVDLLLDSIQRNTNDYFISIILSNKCIRWERLPPLRQVETFQLSLTDDWYNKYCGVLMFAKTNVRARLLVNMIIKQDNDDDDDVYDDDDDDDDDDAGDDHLAVDYADDAAAGDDHLAVDYADDDDDYDDNYAAAGDDDDDDYDDYDYPDRDDDDDDYYYYKNRGLRICVGYVSFSSLSHTKCLNSTYRSISFTILNYPFGSFDNRDQYLFDAVLISKGDPKQTTEVTPDTSEFWNEDQKEFGIQKNSNSSIKISWTPQGRW